jgi:hypothetical protein
MMEFIVLGHIPGTNIYLSFIAVMIITIDIFFVSGALKVIKLLWLAQIKSIKTKQALIFAHSI